MLIIATIGLLVNILVAWILMRGGDTKENLNIRAAFLHVIGDLLGSVGHYCGSDDPLLQLGLGRSVGQCDCCSACIDKWVAKRCRSCIDGGYPKNVEIDAVIKTIESIPGVNNMHDLHVWSITSGQNALSCHVVVDGTISIQESQEILRTIEDELEDENIGHATIQMESETTLIRIL